MFYSHEILTSQQYGVATVWLVSTIGIRTTNRKISRKAIQEVDVQKACETILQPGAPIALRLQGSLLYGVSRVYSQQCSYVLTDAERIQAHMRAFYNSLDIGTNITDPLAGKSKRTQLILPDDPNFDLNTRLPAFHFDEEGNIVLPEASQVSRKTSSQMSPFSRDSLNNSASAGGSFLDGFELPASHSSQMYSLLGPPGTMEKYRLDGQMMPVEEGNGMAIDDWGIEIDADGNVMSIDDESDLPQLPPLAGAGQDAGGVQQGERNPFFHDQDEAIMNMDEPILPDADAFAPRQQDQGQMEGNGFIEVEMSSDQVAMPARRQEQRRRALLAPDRETKVTRNEMRSWGNDYLDNVERERARKSRRVVTVTDTRNNAYTLVFGRGLGDIGFPTGIPGVVNPLADLFAGDKLRAGLLGEDAEEVAEAPRGRRRSAFEALELEEDDNERRVRPRLDNDSSQAGQGQGRVAGDEFLPLLNEEVEVGREAGLLLDDNIPSDVPWNRPSSQIPSSSVKGGKHGQVSGRQISASPLHGRGSQLQAIERSSGQPHFGSDDFGSAKSAAHTFSDPLEEGFQPQGEARTSQMMHNALGREGSNFLNYMERVAEEKGEVREDDGDRQWVKFDELFEQPDQKRDIVARAFYHVLSLATKNAIKVEQEGQNTRPFGTIHIGVEVPDGPAGRAGGVVDGEMDELA
ncbi:putative sister chromatid cohesion protein [Lasiosphaeria hispida]|uniref:Sister chromatid cohesion protein n=1 Tax=Lasiosphaeria hispida TaxID=260671 RepID=A0AAJ0HUX7_9PEZI|nr:putative sister chromatid cohesion protein [Lasiosphaeria hispida]